MDKKRVLIMAGGTGGHVFPALAIAKALKEQGYEILWLGTRGRMEEALVPKYGFDIRYIDVKGVRRNGLKAMLKAPFMVIHAVRQALKVIKEFKPNAVLGMGGYASGPGGVAAFLSKIPVILHEQNAAAGLTNKLLFKIATKVMLGFPGAFTGSKVELVGNPVRDNIVQLHDKKKSFTHDKLKIAIVGGSLGAKALNELVPKALCLFDEDKIEVTHQCGKGNSQKVEPLYKDAKFKVAVSDFIDDMQALYENSDLIICRAGASTVAETCCANLPAIFIPLPTAVDDHQTRNAQFLQKANAAFIFKQNELKPEELFKTVAELEKDREKLIAMSLNSHEVAITDACSKACSIIDKIVIKNANK